MRAEGLEPDTRCPNPPGSRSFRGCWWPRPTASFSSTTWTRWTEESAPWPTSTGGSGGGGRGGRLPSRDRSHPQLRWSRLPLMVIILFLQALWRRGPERSRSPGLCGGPGPGPAAGLPLLRCYRCLTSRRGPRHCHPHWWDHRTAPRSAAPPTASLRSGAHRCITANPPANKLFSSVPPPPLSRSPPAGYSEDGGVRKGEIIPEYEFAAGPICLDDENEFPPVSMHK